MVFIKNFESRKEKNNPLINKLLNTGIERSCLDKFKPLLEKIKFSNIDISKEENKIHVDMLSFLLMNQNNKHIFLQNILKKINHKWEQINEILIKTTKEIKDESIDLEIGSNRRVDKIEITFNDNLKYCFTLSADIDENIDEKESNSYIEKEIFESELSENNPWLQKYFGYMDNKISNRNYRMIAKEYLPGKNVSQYCNGLEEKEEIVDDFRDVVCEVAYSMNGLYRRMNGQILEDLKLENLIYNFEDKDSNEPLCRICDHSGYYENKVGIKSVNQILAHIESFIVFYYKKSKYLGQGDTADNLRAENALDIEKSYVDSFLGDLDESLRKRFLEEVKNIKNQNLNDRFFEIREDVLDYILENY